MLACARQDRDPAQVLEVQLLDVRRLAALDMHGGAGRRLRRRVILAEFILGALGCTSLGLFGVIGGGVLGWRIFGAWIVGIGLNYGVLALHALSLSRPGALEAELASVDLGRELRRYSYLQFWLAVPLLFAVLAVGQRRSRSLPFAGG